MSQPRVPDDLWEAVAPLLPRERPKLKGARPRPERVFEEGQALRSSRLQAR